MTEFNVNWREGAACKDKDTSLFFPYTVTRANSSKILDAFTICESCPVSAHCLYEAFINDYDGIWGRTTRQQRHVYLSELTKEYPDQPLTVDMCSEYVLHTTQIHEIPYSRSYRSRPKKTKLPVENTNT